MQLKYHESISQVSIIVTVNVSQYTANGLVFRQLQQNYKEPCSISEIKILYP